MKMKVLCFSMLGLICGLLPAQNLIRNPDFNEYFVPECRFDMTPGALKISTFTEDRTWNKCLKLEVNQYHKQKDGTERLYGVVRIGGDKKNNGFAVKPNTVYSYSLEIRGTASASIQAFEWNGPDYWKDMKRLKITGQEQLKPSDEWVTVKGTFQTGPGATHAAIGLSLWGESRYKNLPPVGSYLLIDKVNVEEKADLLGSLKKEQGGKMPDVPLERVALQGSEPLRGFSDYKTGKNAGADTVVDVQAGEKSIRLKIRCLEPMMDRLQASVKGNGGNPWKDDCVEIFFAPVVPDRALSQFVVAAGGGRWMGYGADRKADDFGRWTAKVSREKDAWIADVEIPYALLGWKARPAPGSEIRFNLARNRKPVQETSSWSFAGGSFHDLSRFGVLLFDSMEAWKKNRTEAMAKDTSDPALLKKISDWKLSGNPAVDYSRAQSLQNAIGLSRRGNRTFILTQTSPTADPTIPFLPSSIASPPDRISIRAAGNEFKALPLSITNGLDRVEEYRLSISSVTSRGEEESGLKTADGKIFPADKIKLCRGIRVKDGDEETHGLRYDPLVSMDDSSTVAVPPNESAPVWAIFDTRNVPPGKYAGVIRAIPLGQRASFDSKTLKYSGPMQDIPFELEVLPFELDRKPARPQFLFQRAFNKECFDMLMDYGSDSVLVNTWGFRVSFNKDGSIAGRDTAGVEEEIRRLLKWASGYGMEKNLKICIAYGAYPIFRDVHSKKQFVPGTPEWKRAWSEYVKTLEDIRRKCGVSNANFIVELVDEPSEKDMDEIIAAARTAHEAVPDMNFMVTLAAWEVSMPKLEQLIPYINHWCLWNTKFFTDEKYAPLMKKLRSEKKNLSNYTCETSMRQNLYQYYRLHPWIAEAYGLDMSCMYQFMSYLSRQADWKMAASGEIARMSSGHPVSTIRQECLRIGANDLKYLRKLSEVLKNSGSEDAKLRAEAEAFLKEVPARVGIQKRFDPEQAEAAREKAIGYILKLSR